MRQRGVAERLNRSLLATVAAQAWPGNQRKKERDRTVRRIDNSFQLSIVSISNCGY